MGVANNLHFQPGQHNQIMTIRPPHRKVTELTYMSCDNIGNAKRSLEGATSRASWPIRDDGVEEDLDDEVDEDVADAFDDDLFEDGSDDNGDD